MTKSSAGLKGGVMSQRLIDLVPFYAPVLFLLVGIIGMPSYAAQKLFAWGDIKYELPAPGWSATNFSLSQISAGSFHSVTLSGKGFVEVWGDNRFNQTNLPDVLKTNAAVSIAAGNVHSIALLPSGKVIAWGPLPGQSGDYGQCNIPSDLGPSSKIAAGAVHSLALKPDGMVVAWGQNLYGQSTVPEGLTGVCAVAGGMYHSVALRQNGTVTAWGDNARGQCAVPPGLTNVIAVAAGGYHTLALTYDGQVVSWGTYGLAQCEVPPGLSNVVAIATGDLHSLALKKDGTVVTWGFNTAGQCTVPDGLSKVVAIAARGSHSMALVEDDFRDTPELFLQYSKDNVIISWPVTAAPVVLQQSPDLTPGSWIQAEGTPKEVDARYILTLPSSERMFYRLVSSP